VYKIIGADGREYGPVTAEQLRQWVGEGRVNQKTLTQAAGTTEWRPLAVLPELSPSLPPMATSASTTNSTAVAGLVFGLLGLTGGWFCCGPLFSVLGIAFSSVGLSQIRRNPAQNTGRGIAIAGLVLSILGLIATLILGVLFGTISILGHAPMFWQRHWRL
jgi:hypothetical protein